MKVQSYCYNFLYAIHLRKPQLTVRIIKNYFDILLRKKILLRYIDACVTTQCNLTCQHCFANNFKREGKKELSISQWADIFKQCRALGNLAIGFTGGEPLLRNDLEDLIHSACPDRTLIVVCTNGMLLSKQRALSLRKAGVDSVQISIESLDQEAHNSFRNNQNAFVRSMEGLENALASGIRVAVVPTVSHYNITTQGFRDLLMWAYKKNLIVNLALATPMGGWNGRMDVLLTDQDFKILNELTREFPNVRRDFETNYFRRACGAAVEKLYFTAYGDVFPCPYMHITFGNAHDTPVSTIRERMFSVDKLKGYYPKCLMAEDRDFINGPLSKVYGRKERVVPWVEVFGKGE